MHGWPGRQAFRCCQVHNQVLVCLVFYNHWFVYMLRIMSVVEACSSRKEWKCVDLHCGAGPARSILHVSFSDPSESSRSLWTIVRKFWSCLMKTLISDFNKYMLFTLHSKVHTVWCNQMGIVFYGDIVLQSFNRAFRDKDSFSDRTTNILVSLLWRF